MNIAKKIIAIVTLLTVFAWVGGPGVSVAQAITLAELEALIASLTQQLAAAQTQLTALQGTGAGTGACAGITFSTTLSQGSSDASVKCLQAILNQSADTKVAASGAGSPGNESTYFGSLTKAAVIKFQNKYASEVLTPLGLTAGTGVVGVKTRAKLNTMTGGAVSAVCGNGTCESGETSTSCPADCPVPGAGENKVSLAANTPAAATIAKGAQDVIFAKINFCAASEANTVSKIIFTRTGVAADTDISTAKLYDGTTQVGSNQAVNSTTHLVTFSSLNWTIPANSCKVLTVKVSLSASATAGDTPKLAINAASDITSTVTLDGVFPISSNAMTIAGIAVGALNVATTTPSGSVVAGATEQGVAGFRLTASSTEGLKITYVKLTEVGSSVDADMSNIKLFYQSTQLGSTVAALTNSTVEFDLSAASLEILAGNSKDITVYVDVGSGTGIKDRTIQFEMTDNTYITAYGTNSGGSVISYGNTTTWSSASDNWPQKAASIAINLGSLTVAQATAYSPSSQSYARGSPDNQIVAFQFTAGANESIRITKLKFTKASSSLDTDVSNITLYDAETGAQLKDTAGNTVAPASMVSGIVTFGANTTGFDTVGLFDIPKSTSKYILVKADINSAAATGTNYFGLKLATANTDVWADGLSSKTDISTSLISPTSKIPATDLVHTILEKGTLTVGANAGTPAAANYAVGTTGFTFAKFDLTSTGEDISVTQFNVYFGTSSNATSTSNQAGTGDINNVQLYDGDTLLKTDAQISSGYGEFAISLTVPKNGTKTLTVKGDIPTGSSGGGLQAWINSRADITATGKGSGVTIYATAADWTAVRGSFMTKATAILSLSAAPTPASKTIIQNTAGALVATIYLTATPTEDIKVTRIQIAGGATTTATTTASTATTTFSSLAEGSNWLGSYDVKDYVGNVKLYDGTTQIGSTAPTMTHGSQYDYADFTGLSLNVPKGTTKAIDVKLDVNRATTTAANAGVCFYFGVATTTGTSVDVSGSGLSSGSTATIATQTGGAGSQCMLFGTSGTLTVQVAADTSVSAQLVEGSSLQELGKWKFTSTNEGIKISKLILEATHSSAATGTSAAGTGWEAKLSQMASSTVADSKQEHKFIYSLNGGATSTCSFWWGTAAWTTTTMAAATTSDKFILVMNSASSTCWASTSAGIMAETATTSGLILYASPAGNYSLQITDHPNSKDAVGTNASNSADDIYLGVKYGGTEAVGAYAGNDGNILKTYLYDGTTKLGESVLVNGSSTFTFSSGAEVVIPANGSKTLTLKADLSDYNSAIEGSTLSFSIGSAASNYYTNYMEAVGASSGATSTIYNSAGATSGDLAANTMYLYGTKPTVSLNSASPSGAQSVGTNKEVFRFDVANANTGNDLNIQAIRFTISTNASSAAMDKLYKLYKSSDLSTVIGQAVSWASATSSATTGYVTIYPYSGYTVGSGSTVTYVLKANTSSMNESSSKTETLTLSIEDTDFFFNDSLAASANQKVLNLPVTGNTLSY